MKKEFKIAVAEDDGGHTPLSKRNLKRASSLTEILYFKNNQEKFDFLFDGKQEAERTKDIASLLLPVIKMPRMHGIEVSRRVKQSVKLKKTPVL